MLTLGDQARYVAGYVHGLRQPCWAFSAAPTALLSPPHVNAVVTALQHALPGWTGAAPRPSGNDALRLFLSAARAVHTEAGLEFVELGKAMRRPSVELPYLLLVPTFSAVSATALQALVALHRLCASREPESQSAELTERVRELREAVPGGANLPHLLRHAARLGIPVLHVQGSVFQFGQGSRSHWLDSTFTEHTSRTAAQLARNKLAGAAVLRRQGLPVPNHHRVSSADDAVDAASRLGSAVVVKPADLDGGVGVWTDLHTAQQVRDAYRRAREHSQILLVEAHLPGRDYRLVVFRGELIWAIERVPASVVGDGRQSIEQLVAEANRDARRRGGRGSPLQPLQLDDEALGLLHEQQLTTASVPARGTRVRLRRAANVATGGWPVPVLDQVHAENRALAVAAADALRLDLAGIDFITPDIARSWREVGGGICEVNAQPNIGVLTADHLFTVLLQRLVPSSGRVPVVLVIGMPAPSRVAAQIAARWQVLGRRVGLADAQGARVGGTTLGHAGMSAYAACLAVLLCRSVDALVVETDDAQVFDQGLPLDRIDWLLAGPAAERRFADGRDLLSFFSAVAVGRTTRAEDEASLNADWLDAQLQQVAAAHPDVSR